MSRKRIHNYTYNHGGISHLPQPPALHCRLQQPELLDGILLPFDILQLLGDLPALPADPGDDLLLLGGEALLFLLGEERGQAPGTGRRRCRPDPRRRSGGSSAIKSKRLDLMTHFLLHQAGNCQLARGDEGALPKYRDPEWQANCFAAELMAPGDKIPWSVMTVPVRARPPAFVKNP